MQLGMRGAAFIKRFEQCRLTAYAATEDERARNIWTIGWGHTHGVHEDMTCTQEQADAWFRADVAEYEDAVNAIGVPLTQAMFDALVSLSYNVGARSVADHSTIGAALRKREYLRARDGFGLWVKQSGKKLKGLEHRRANEKSLFTADGFPKDSADA